MNDKENNENSSSSLLKGDQSRYVDYAFGNVKLQSLEVAGNLVLNSIAMGNPIDGGTVIIPTNSTIVLIQNTVPYTQLTMKMPLQPRYGQTLTITSTVDIPNLSLTGATFGTKEPIAMIENVPLRFVFAGSWFNI